MKMQTQWKRILIGGAAALTLTAGTLWTVDQVSASSSTTSFIQAVQEQVGGFGRHGGPRGEGRDGAISQNHQQYLADELGITLETLEAAHETVRNTLIDQAVADGTITQEQADQLKAGERVRVRGLRLRGGHNTGEHNTLLASTLGITVEQLETAKANAKDAALVDALAAGDITQEQFDTIEARHALQDYVEAQYGEERPDLTKQELIQQAVTAGAITQEQADLLLNHDGFERRGRGGRQQDRVPQPNSGENPQQNGVNNNV